MQQCNDSCAIVWLFYVGHALCRPGLTCSRQCSCHCKTAAFTMHLTGPSMGTRFSSLCWSTFVSPARMHSFQESCRCFGDLKQCHSLPMPCKCSTKLVIACCLKAPQSQSWLMPLQTLISSSNLLMPSCWRHDDKHLPLALHE